jgi:hypothetical protein
MLVCDGNKTSISYNNEMTGFEPVNETLCVLRVRGTFNNSMLTGDPTTTDSELSILLPAEKNNNYKSSTR